MKKNKENEIIKKAVKKAFDRLNARGLGHIKPLRNDVARNAALFADYEGVNVQSASYLHDMFIEALDEIFCIN